MRDRLYKVSIFYFLCFMLAVVGSGGLLFVVELGTDSWRDAYSLLTQQRLKSMEGIIEIATPHLFGMGLLLFVLFHFLFLSEKTDTKRIMALFFFSTLIILLDQSSYLLISIGWEIFGWIKLSLVLLLVVLFSLLGVMVARTLKGIQ